MKHVNRIVAFILVVVLLVSTDSVNAMAASSIPVEGKFVSVADYSAILEANSANQSWFSWTGGFDVNNWFSSIYESYMKVYNTYLSYIWGGYGKVAGNNSNLYFPGAQKPGKKKTPVPTKTPTTVVTPIVTPTPVVTPEPTPVVTPIPVITPEPTPIPVITPEPTPIPVITPEPTPIPVITPEPTAVPTPAVTPEPTPVVTPIPEPDVTPTPVLNKDSSVAGYTESMMKWHDEFEGTSLNRDDWNVELHNAGWVNSEKQKYVDSTENIFVENGNLVLRATGSSENTIESGRINTQNKQDFKYGVFEVRAKVPEGKGFLPAFWLMPTNENLYGQWPKCGEIDAMEVMGQDTTKAYGTIHYGEPHKENQGTKVLSSGSYSEEYHVFATEWNPGEIIWYVDGVEYYRTQNWYSQKIGQGKVTYPAPFDQDFYVILNLAVGGSWVGYPDDYTSVNGKEFLVDYVRVYQKDSYDENVTEPEEELEALPTPDSNGNYVRNGGFTVAESLTDDEDWKFMTALSGEANAQISDGKISIATTNQGTADYSVQLVQPHMPLEKGATYEVKFDAKASANRIMNCAVKAPSFSYEAHMSNNVNLTTDWQTFTYTCTLNDGFETDPNCRLEFNMGNASSTATIEIKNVSYKKTQNAPSAGEEVKKVLKDGNLVYNGTFEQGANRLGYWTISNNNNALVSVSSLSDSRRLVVDGSGVEISQSGLAKDSTVNEYLFTIDVDSENATSMTFVVLGKTFTKELYAGKNSISEKITKTEATGTDLRIIFPNGLTKIDNVRLVENSLIKNGNFNGGDTGYEWYTDSSASASFVVNDMDTPGNSFADITINNTANEEWKIQLKQNTVNLTKDCYYKLSFDIRSSMNRSIQYAIQRNGAVHTKANGEEDWTPYVQDTVALTASAGEYTNVTKYFKMDYDSDTASIFNIALGGGSITTQHRICIDNVSLVEISEADMPHVEPEGTNLITDGEFASVINADPEVGWKGWKNTIANWGGEYTTDASCSVTSPGNIKYNIKNVGTADWNVQIKNVGINLVSGKTYYGCVKLTSTINRKVKVGLMGTGNAWYEGKEVSLVANQTQYVYFEKTMSTSDTNGFMFISMGYLGEDNLTEHNITISDVKLIEVGSIAADGAIIEEDGEICEEILIEDGAEILVDDAQMPFVSEDVIEADIIEAEAADEAIVEEPIEEVAEEGIMEESIIEEVIE